MRALLLGLALAALPISLPAFAAPPEHSDPTMAPWFQGLKQPWTGMGCCNLSDCRFVDAKPTKQGWQVYITKADFPVDEDRWVVVPEDRILRGKSNPWGRAVVCYLPGLGVLCFVEPAGV